jgi:hypothetical protein
MGHAIVGIHFLGIELSERAIGSAAVAVETAALEALRIGEVEHSLV